MNFDTVSYIIGYKGGYNKGEVEGASMVVIEGGVTCTDDGNGNITITEDN